MKNLNKIILFFIGLIFISCSGNINCMKKITSNPDFEDYYVVAEIENQDNIFTIVLPYSDLYQFLKKENKISGEEFEKFMLKNHQPIKIDDIKILDFKLTNNDSVKKIAKRGKNEFLKYYFDGFVIKDKFAPTDLKPIIYELYKWDIIASVDDETGFLIITDCE